MFKNLSNIILLLAVIISIYNLIRTARYRRAMYLERLSQFLLTNDMIENRNRFVQIIKANHVLMKFTHENLTKYKSDILENAFENDAEVPEEFTKRLDSVLDELQSRITRLEIGELTGDLRDNITYEEIMELAIKRAKEANKNESH